MPLSATLVAAALLAPGNLVIIDLALDPGAAQSRPIPFDAAAVRAAIAFQLAQAGIPVAGGQGASRLVVRVTQWDPGNGVGLGQTARMTASYRLRRANGEESEPMSAMCEAKAAFGLSTTPGQRTRLAWTRCLDEFSASIVNGLTGGNDAVVVR